MRYLVMITLATVALAACGSKDGAPTGELDKAAAVKMLESVFANAEGKKIDAMMQQFAAPPGKEGELKGQLEKIDFIAKKEISAAGIKVLAEKGKFGAAVEVLGAEKAERRAKRFGADPKNCKAFTHDNAQAIFCQFDKSWKLIRLNNIGKLQ